MLIVYDDTGRIVYTIDDVKSADRIPIPDDLNYMIIDHNIVDIYNYCIHEGQLTKKLKADIVVEDSRVQILIENRFPIETVRVVVSYSPFDGQELILPVVDNKVEVELNKQGDEKFTLTIDDPKVEYKEVVI